MTAKEVSKYRSESPTMPVQDKERRKEAREGRKEGIGKEVQEKDLRKGGREGWSRGSEERRARTENFGSSSPRPPFRPPPSPLLAARPMGPRLTPVATRLTAPFWT
jgi:hypothetical protein